MALLPGRATPDAAYATDQMRIVDAVIQRAIGVPAFAGIAGEAPGGPTPFLGGPRGMKTSPGPATGDKVDKLLDQLFPK